MRADVLEVHVAEPERGAAVSIPIEVGEQRLTVTFKELPRKHTYFVRLDRIPVIAAARSAGLQIRLGAAGHGAAVIMQSICVPADDLY
jgi:hypothetical protein